MANARQDRNAAGRAAKQAGTRFKTSSPRPASHMAHRADDFSVRPAAFSSRSSRGNHAASSSRAQRPARPAPSSSYGRAATAAGRRGRGSSDRGVSRSAYTRAGSRRTVSKSRKSVLAPALIAIVAILLAGFVVFRVIVPVFSPGKTSTVAAGKQVTIDIPEGSSGDAIASILSKNHVIEDPKDYYAAVKKLQADSALQPGTYSFTTLQDPMSVVEQLMKGSNVAGHKLVVPEGYTVDQLASLVNKTFGISVDDFKAQAKVSNYENDYPFLKGAYNDSLEGYLYPKTYLFTDGKPTSDSIIRKMLDQFRSETKKLDLEKGANGLSEYQLISMASLIERESAVLDERPKIASVMYNRLNKDMPLQIDAAIVYARGGGSKKVSYDDLKIDSPYNTYANKGLTPGPICSPSLSSIKAAVIPAHTDYLYYVVSSSKDGSHKFSNNYEQFQKDCNEYSGSKQ